MRRETTRCPLCRLEDCSGTEYHVDGEGFPGHSIDRVVCESQVQHKPDGSVVYSVEIVPGKPQELVATLTNSEN